MLITELFEHLCGLFWWPESKSVGELKRALTGIDEDPFFPILQSGASSGAVDDEQLKAIAQCSLYVRTEIFGKYSTEMTEFNALVAPYEWKSLLRVPPTANADQSLLDRVVLGDQAALEKYYDQVQAQRKLEEDLDKIRHPKEQ